MGSDFDPRWYQALFAKMGAEYEDFPFTKNTEDEVDWMTREYLTDHGMKIIDVGCGTGRHAVSLAARGYESITGVDLSPSMLEAAKESAARKNVRVNFILGDARHLPFENDFDAALCLCEGAFGLLEDDAENYKILRAVHRSLRKNGVFILTTLNLFRDEKFDPMTCRTSIDMDITDKNGQTRTLKCSDRSYTFPELKWVLEQTGFEVLRGADPFSRNPIRRGAMEFMVVSRKT
jgi:ubiquinone/menaquinone biosynthesis C-methylase UbiE